MPLSQFHGIVNHLSVVGTYMTFLVANLEMGKSDQLKNEVTILKEEVKQLAAEAPETKLPAEPVLEVDKTTGNGQQTVVVGFKQRVSPVVNKIIVVLEACPGLGITLVHRDCSDVVTIANEKLVVLSMIGTREKPPNSKVLSWGRIESGLERIQAQECGVADQRTCLSKTED
eukprot:15365639-Ditylum_brightwellii.AAC.1